MGHAHDDITAALLCIHKNSAGHWKEWRWPVMVAPAPILLTMT